MEHRTGELIEVDSPATEQEPDSPRLNRAQLRHLIRTALPRENRVKYFFGLHRYPSKLLPKPSNFVRLRKQMGQ